MTSVLTTQDRVDQVKQEVIIANEFLTLLHARLAEAVAAHREQIAKSLKSKDPKERNMAESIAAWWDVKPVTSSLSQS